MARFLWGALIPFANGGPVDSNANPSDFFRDFLGDYAKPDGQTWTGFLIGYQDGHLVDSSRVYFDLDTFSLAVPVPEHSTYGMILGGLALAGAAVRRRRTLSR